MKISLEVLNNKFKLVKGRFKLEDSAIEIIQSKLKNRGVPW